MSRIGNISAQVDALIGALDDEEQRLRDVLERWLEMSVNFIAERAVANAPILSGDLRAAMEATKPHWEGNEVFAKVINTIPYALVQHEVLTPAGHWQLGPISEVQPGTVEGGVGGYYIQRVVLHNLPKLEDLLKKMLAAKGLNTSFTISTD